MSKAKQENSAFMVKYLWCPFWSEQLLFVVEATGSCCTLILTNFNNMDTSGKFQPSWTIWVKLDLPNYNKVTRPPPVATKFNKLESKVASWTTCSQMQGSFLATVDGNHRMAASFLGTLNWYLHLFTNFIKASTVDLCFSASTNNTYVELIRNIKNDKHRREINKKDVFL